MEKDIATRLRELAKQIEQLSADVAKIKQTATDPDDINDIQELSDNLFSIQSKMNYEYYSLAQAIWGD